MISIPNLVVRAIWTMDIGLGSSLVELLTIGLQGSRIWFPMHPYIFCCITVFICSFLLSYYTKIKILLLIVGELYCLLLFIPPIMWSTSQVSILHYMYLIDWIPHHMTYGPDINTTLVHVYLIACDLLTRYQ